MSIPLGRLALWGGLVALVVVAVVLSPGLSTIYHLESGGRVLEAAKAFRTEHPHDPNPSLDRALSHFRRATEISPQDGYAHRRLGQAWLLAGNNEAAREALAQAAALRPNHPLIWVELGSAYDGLGLVDKALEAYERGGYGPAVEAAIVNYIKVADWQAESGAGDYALQILRDKVLPLDADNLPALCRMLRIYEGTSQEAAEQFGVPLRERLQTLGAQEIDLPEEPRLVAYYEQAARDLVQEGIWTQAQADRLLGR